MWLLIKNSCLSDDLFEGILKDIISKGGGKDWLEAAFICCAEENFFCLNSILEEMSVEPLEETDPAELTMGFAEFVVGQGSSGQ